MGSSFKVSSHCMDSGTMSILDPSGFYYFRSWSWSRDREGKGWWKGNEEEWQSPGLHLLPPADAQPSPHPQGPPCTSSRAHRLEGRQVLTNHTDTLIPACGAVSSARFQVHSVPFASSNAVLPPGVQAWDPKRLTQVVRHWGNTGYPPKCLGY